MIKLLDTKVPQVELIGTPPARSTYDIGAFYWESDEYAKYECAVDLAESGTPCGSGRSMNWNSPRLDDGEHTFYLFATDTNGNQARTKEYIWKIGKLHYRQHNVSYTIVNIFLFLILQLKALSFKGKINIYSGA